MSYYKIRPRSGTAAQWTSANPILAEREIGFEYPAGGLGTGLVKMKMGDGSTHWNDLPYATVSPIVENVESSSTENVPSSAYVKTKFDTLNSKSNILYSVYDGRCELSQDGPTNIFRVGNLCVASCYLKMKKALTSSQTTILTLQNNSDFPSPLVSGLGLNFTKSKVVPVTISATGNINLYHGGNIAINDTVVFQIIWTA